jgi:hypothetical protein
MSTGTPAAAQPSLVQRAIDAVTVIARDPNPILVKELRSIFRTNLFIRFLYISTGLIAIVVLGGGALVATGSLPPAEVGKVVFQIFFGTALIVVVLVAPAYAATAITSEREQRTYESLVLSGMDEWRIIRGKFLASYASMFLVLVAQAPVVGVAFLFGGISFGHVVAGYAALLLALAPAIALGVAVSARLSSTRIAILIVTIVFTPTAFFILGGVAAFGELAQRAWGVGMQGPFWFTDALVTHTFELDVLGLLVALPIYLVGMPVWLLLASAVAGITPAAEDRSTPFKAWAIVTIVGLVVISALIPLLTGDPNDTGEASIAVGIAIFFPLMFVSMVFMNEPPLPPRLFEQRVKGSPLRWVAALVGPGAAPTLRFSLALLVLGTVLVCVAPMLTRHLYWPLRTDSLRYDLGLIALAIGNSAMIVFFTGTGVFLRTYLRSGAAARILALTIFGTIALMSLMWTVIVDPDSFDRLDREIPILIQLGPLMPSVLAVDLANGTVPMSHFLLVLTPTILFGGAGAVCWVLVEMRVRKARAADETSRAKREEVARTSQPTIPLLRSSRPSGGSKPPPALASPAAEPAADPGAQFEEDAVTVADAPPEPVSEPGAVTEPGGVTDPGRAPIFEPAAVTEPGPGPDTGSDPDPEKSA